MTAAWWVLFCYMLAVPFPLIGNGDYLLAFSFYLNGALIAYMSWECLVKDRAGPAFATISTFMLLFFYVAPVFQLLEYQGYLINNYNAPISQMLMANLLLFIFMATFVIMYRRRMNVEHVPFIKVSEERVDNAFLIYAAVAAIMVIWAVRFMITDADTTAVDSDTAVLGDIMAIVRHKIAFVIPFAALGFYLSKSTQRRSIIMVGMLAVFVLLTKNILLDRRNALGPVYLSVAFLFLWRGRISSRSVFLLVGSALLFVFPITSIFINNPTDRWSDLLTVENATKEIRGHFVDMHYDAWASLVGGMQYVQTEGLQLGHQLLGTLLVFLPRDMWADKPVSSAQLVGQYLVDNHGLWFTNISFPVPAEGYLDFGVLGVFLYAMAIAIYSQRLDYFINRGNAVDRTSALYFSFYLTFVMRGSLLPAFAYGAGAYVAMNIFPWVISKLGLKSRYANFVTTSLRPAAGRR